KSQETAYDAIKLWVRKSDGLPVKAQYFGTSGQMLRSAEFSDYVEFEKGYQRPAKVVMRNELVKSRRSEMVVKSLKRGVEVPAQRFTQTDLGR
ncbi:outer membrane lipoprotein-sorting protein, partial [Hyalangium sp.]|uniref:outer membrane lipoprotein-sorting protein n=1 Tax=Hyalangium sp. TaxID=2028555 RepID=UPI002D61A83F